MLDACRLARVFDECHVWMGWYMWVACEADTCLRVVVGFAVGYVAFVRIDGGSRGRRTVGLSCWFAYWSQWFMNSTCNYFY
jgi:hypothetical protein